MNGIVITAVAGVFGLGVSIPTYFMTRPDYRINGNKLWVEKEDAPKLGLYSGTKIKFADGTKTEISDCLDTPEKVTAYLRSHSEHSNITLERE